MVVIKSNKGHNKISRRSTVNKLARGNIYRIHSRYSLIEFYDYNFLIKNKETVKISSAQSLRNQKFIDIQNNDLALYLEKIELIDSSDIGFPNLEAQIEIPIYLFINNKGRRFVASASDVEKYFEKVC